MDARIPPELAAQNIFAPELLECPHAFYKQLREHAPVVQNLQTGIFQISSYDLIVQALRDTEHFSNDVADELRGGNQLPPEVLEVAMQGYPPADTLLTADPPAHTRYRKLVNKAFTPARVNALEGEIARIAFELIDAFIGDGEVELLSQFAQPLPLRLIATQLGVPLADMDKFRVWSDAITTLLGQTSDTETTLQCMKAFVAFQHYFAAVLAAKRIAPTDDIISDLANVTLTEDGDPRALTDPEALSVIQQILVAGNETTANSIVAGMKLLLDHPQKFAAIQADPTLIPNFVEEVLRISAAVQSSWRLAMKDITLDGVLIPKGSKILLRFAAGNRDESQFAHGESFDPARANARKHLSFGLGIHMCLGATLARKEMAVAFTALLSRVRGWRFGENDFTHHHSILLRGLKALNLRFEK
jgi:cytochrome P450